MSDTPKTTAGWEFFMDSAYYDMWCVRCVGEHKFQLGFHVASQNEARVLAALLTDTERRLANANLDRTELKDRLDYFELQLNKALRERDEALAQAEQWNKFGVKHRELAQKFRNERDDARRELCLVSKEREELKEREEWHQRCHEEVSEKMIEAMQQRDQAAARAAHAENALEAATAHRDEARREAEEWRTRCVFSQAGVKYQFQGGTDLPWE